MSFEQLILNKISKKAYALFDTIKEYESDTFSAEGSELTEEEAEAITVTLINRALQSMIDTETLDGVTIDEMLSDMREDNEEY